MRNLTFPDAFVRRAFLRDTLALAATACLPITFSTAQTSAQLFEGYLGNLETDPSLSISNRARDELDRIIEYGLERAPLRIPKSRTPISERASRLIIASEVSSKKKYLQNYRRPTWPKGKSGVTIGIGYDVGYVTVYELGEDWKGYIPEAQIEKLAEACGNTGSVAASLAQNLQDISIDWEPARNQYVNEGQPRYVGMTEAALPNTRMLSPDSLGALVSLVYNRGPSFGISEAKDTEGRYREMRNIKRMMTEKNLSAIPAEIRSMKRIWEGVPDMRGLLTRRDAEASLFEIGLEHQ
ncbi:hypothetical protein [Rhodomicrobium lacus]|uniref:hypothetical protein n=1 Tax=Rhodomicrobium lacus TaxID=2498452 RepID=UPI000F8CA469|nr:hypothetical protein [Rhodomicrobium lacus]